MAPAIAKLKLSISKLSGSRLLIVLGFLFYIFVVGIIFWQKDFFGRDFVIWTFSGLTILFTVFLVVVASISLGAESSTKGVSAVLEMLHPAAQKEAVVLMLTQSEKNPQDRGVIEVTGHPIESIKINKN